jgi:plasmid stability protein
MLVPTLHIRGVPADLYQRLRERAEDNGRSLNAEVIEVLAAATPRKRSFEEVMRSIEERARRLELHKLPDPVDLIREDRDSH